VIAAFVPPRTDVVTHVSGHAKCHWKSEIGGNLGGVFLGIHGARIEAGTQFRERGTAFFIASQQPATEGSPVAAVEQDDGKWGVDIIG
jgi:hypothetical protein